MNAFGYILTAAVAACLTMAGCGKSSSVDPAPIESSFKTADSATKGSADKVVSAIKSSDYSGALSELKTLAGKAKLTPEQQQAVKDVMAQVQKALTDAAGQAASGASKTAEDLKKTLPK
jgi:hypothetical protein